MPPVRLGLSGRNSKTAETLWERFLEFPSRVRLGSPKPYNSRHLKLPEHFKNPLPLNTAGHASFFQTWFRRGPLGARHGISSSTEGISDLSPLPAAQTSMYHWQCEVTNLLQAPKPRKKKKYGKSVSKIGFSWNPESRSKVGKTLVFVVKNLCSTYFSHILINFGVLGLVASSSLHNIGNEIDSEFGCKLLGYNRERRKRRPISKTHVKEFGAECTKPSHSQSLANLVAKIHSQGISAVRTKISLFHSQNHSHSLANSFATLNSQLFVWIGG